MQSNRLYKVICDIPEEINRDCKEWVNQQPQHIRASVEDICCDHVTVLFGFKESEIPIVEKVLRENTEPLEVTLGPVTFGSISPVCIVKAISQPLQNLFWKIREAVPDSAHTLINGEYDPHITLFWFNKYAPIHSTELNDIQQMAGKTFTLTNVHVA
jgi:2'-5' RNA ligase